MGPPPRSLAAEANGCFMVRVRHGPNRIQGCGARDAPDSGLPSDQSKHASTIGEQSDAIELDTDIPIQGCVKTPEPPRGPISFAFWSPQTAWERENREKFRSPRSLAKFR